MAGQRGTPAAVVARWQSLRGAHGADSLRLRDAVAASDARRPRRSRPPDTIRGMDYGLCLPNFPDGASPEGIEAAADVAERLGWSTVWTTDHVLVPHADTRATTAGSTTRS